LTQGNATKFILLGNYFRAVAKTSKKMTRKATDFSERKVEMETTYRNVNAAAACGSGTRQCPGFCPAGG
jgi:hypothetical protein